MFETEQELTEQVASPKDKAPLYEEPLKEMDAISVDIEAMGAYVGISSFVREEVRLYI
jgi:hypothetical protein